jgi:uncharacterized protein
MKFVVVPGIDGSGDQHWQSRWEADWGSRATRIAPASWAAPELEDWCDAIAAAVIRSGPGSVVVAHSLGCLAVTEWLTRSAPAVRGVFLVAPPDRDGPAFPQAAPSFLDLTPGLLSVPGLVIASEDDPYCTPAAAERLAGQWGVPRISIGAHGHLNTASGLGSWRTGRDLLTAFTAGLRTRSD